MPDYWPQKFAPEHCVATICRAIRSRLCFWILFISCNITYIHKSTHNKICSFNTIYIFTHVMYLLCIHAHVHISNVSMCRQSPSLAWSRVSFTHTYPKCATGCYTSRWGNGCKLKASRRLVATWLNGLAIYCSSDFAWSHPTSVFIGFWFAIERIQSSIQCS